MQELTDAISKSHDTGVGPDDIHYQMLKHLPIEALNTLLESLNNIWISRKFPDNWRTSTVKPWFHVQLLHAISLESGRG